jgi:hypothetical protein
MPARLPLRHWLIVIRAAVSSIALQPWGLTVPIIASREMTELQETLPRYPYNPQPAIVVLSASMAVNSCHDSHKEWLTGERYKDR